MTMKYESDITHSGPCAKQVVTATLVDAEGNQYVGTNYCLTPQSSCPRADLPSGVGYEMCKNICNQPAHAEVNSIVLARKHKVKLDESVIYLEGHTFACSGCKAEAHSWGIPILVEAPPN